MTGAEAKGFGVSLAGHVLLLAILSLGYTAARRPPVLSPPMEVSFVDKVDLVSAAPRPAPAAESVAPDPGAPEEAAPAPAPVVAPPPPEPLPAQPVPTKPQPAPKPAEKPAPARPAHPAAAKEEIRKPDAASGAAAKSRGSLLGANFLAGIGRDPSPSRVKAAPGAVMSAAAASDIGSAIQRQIQPCADQQVNPGPGANRIRTRINLRLNRDGSLAARPRVVGQTGIDDGNGRYAERVADLAIAAFTGCAPLRGLPADLYDVPNGWSNFTLNYKLPG